MKKSVLFVCLLLSLQFAFANRHIIHFGGDSSCSYTPGQMQVDVGDTIIWMGNFVTCPLSSGMIPTGALDFKNEGDDMYMYVVRVAGDYEYVSPDYATHSTPAAFYASGNNSLPVLDNSVPVYVVQEQGRNVIYSTLNTTDRKSDYVLNVFDETGNILLNTNIDLGNSRYVLPQLPTGMYFVRVADNEKVFIAKQVWQP